MRQRVISVRVEILTKFYERAIRPDVVFCGHGYIGVTCSHCTKRSV